VHSAVGKAQIIKKVDLEIDRSISTEVESIDTVDSSRVDLLNRSNEREFELVDNIHLKSTFGSGADSAEHCEQ